MFMLDTSEMKQNELRLLSGMARHVSLQEECNKYSKELSLFLKDKDTLLVDLVKALKRITNEWRSWNHKLFGGLSPKAYVASVDQIFELLEWTEKTYPTVRKAESNVKSHWKFCVDTLQRYITIYAQMQRFYSKFVQNIFSPLTVYYKNKNSKKTVAALSKILNNWSILQQTGTMIREECFTSESIQFFMEVMYYSGCRDFYLVLRLIPDLSMKAAECVHMVKSLLDSTTSDGFARERAYIFEVWRPINKFDVQTPWERKLGELSTEKHVVEEEAAQKKSRLAVLNDSLFDAQRKLKIVNSRVSNLSKKKSETEDNINELNRDMAYYKFQVKEVKQSISNNKKENDNYCKKKGYTPEMRRERWISILSQESSQEATLSYPCLRKLSISDSFDSLRLEIKTAEFDIARIQETLTAVRNDLFKVENELKHITAEQKQLEKVVELLTKDKIMIEAELSDIEMNDRVISGYMHRIRKNIKSSQERLPPVSVTPEKEDDFSDISELKIKQEVSAKSQKIEQRGIDNHEIA